MRWEHRVLNIFQAWDNRVKGVIDKGEGVGEYAVTKKYLGRRRRPEKYLGVQRFSSRAEGARRRKIGFSAEFDRSLLLLADEGGRGGGGVCRDQKIFRLLSQV